MNVHLFITKKNQNIEKYSDSICRNNFIKKKFVRSL